MTVYNRDLDEATIESLRQLLDKDISPKIAFELLKITSIVEDIIINKNQIQQKILERYSEPHPEDSTQIIVKQEKVEDFQTEMTELNSIKHEFDLKKITFEDLNMSDNIKSSIFHKLHFLFNIEIPEVKSGEFKIDIKAVTDEN